MPKTIIVPLDGSEFAAQALGPAQVLARQSGAGLLLAMSRLGGVAEPDAYLDATAGGLDFEGTRTYVARDALAATAIPELAESEPDAVVCMTTHGRSGWGVAIFGSIGEEIMLRVARPVVLVGPAMEHQASTPYRELIVCLDGSATSAAILPGATKLARDLELELCLVQVVDPHHAGGGVDGEPTFLQDHAAEIEREGLTVTCETLTDTDPARAIVEFARSRPQSLIAMTTHGRTGRERRVAGSVTMAVVHRGSSPVIVVRNSLPVIRNARAR